MKKEQRSGFIGMARLIGLVRPLGGYMTLAVLLGLLGHLCAAFITILGGYAVLSVLGFALLMPLWALFACAAIFAVLRGVLRYGEQACNHFIAFKLLALIRDKVFRALETACYELDLGKPIWLDSNVEEFRRHAKARFYQDSFIEHIDFDFLEIQVIEE